MIQEHPRLIIVTEATDYAKNIMNALKSFYYHPYYVRDEMPKYQMVNLSRRFSLTVGYAADLPMPDVRNDLLYYEGEYFYHLDDMLYVVDGLSDLKDFKNKSQWRPFDTRKLFDLSQRHKVVMVGFLLSELDPKNPFKCLRTFYKEKTRIRDCITDEVLEGEVAIFFSLVNVAGLDFSVMIVNDEFLHNECWSTFHYQGVTGKTCLNYFETPRFRILNPIFRGVGKQLGKHKLLIDGDELGVELFSFYTEMDWMPVCSMFRHRDKIAHLMDRIAVDIPLPSRIEKETFRIFIDTSSLKVNQRSYLKFGLRGMEVPYTIDLNLFHEYILIKTKPNQNCYTEQSIHYSIPQLEGLDIPADGFTHFGR